MNKSIKFNSYMDYVEQRLEHWAKWFSVNNAPGLGFHSYTREYVLITLGTMVQTSTIKPLPYDEDAEEIEDIVSDMAKYNEKMAKMLCTQYIGKGTVSERAKKLGISYARFRSYVDMARQWVAAKLSTTDHPFRRDTPKY
jgi:hypothetical protein